MAKKTDDVTMIKVSPIYGADGALNMVETMASFDLDYSKRYQDERAQYEKAVIAHQEAIGAWTPRFAEALENFWTVYEKQGSKFGAPVIISMSVAHMVQLGWFGLDSATQTKMKEMFGNYLDTLIGTVGEPGYTDKPLWRDGKRGPGAAVYKRRALAQIK